MSIVSKHWLNRPLWPFLILSLSPLVIAPVTVGIISSLPDCGLDEPWWELRHMQLAFLPGLMNFLPFLWLISHRTNVRWAALVAGVMGATRFALPQVSIALYSASSGGQLGDPSCSVSIFLLALLIPLMAAAWLVSIVVGAVVLRRLRMRPTSV